MLTTTMDGCQRRRRLDAVNKRRRRSNVNDSEVSSMTLRSFPVLPTPGQQSESDRSRCSTTTTTATEPKLVPIHSEADEFYRPIQRQLG
ncbi:hypothetical protein ACLB2K_053450 [Fragaria x ananassa]